MCRRMLSAWTWSRLIFELTGLPSVQGIGYLMTDDMRNGPDSLLVLTSTGPVMFDLPLWFVSPDRPIVESVTSEGYPLLTSFRINTDGLEGLVSVQCSVRET